MAAREFTTPVPRLAEVPFRMLPAARNWERIALKWRNIAERRRDHHLDLYKSERWKHYYTDEEFLIEMRRAVAIADRWADRRGRGARSTGGDRAAGGGLNFPASIVMTSRSAGLFFAIHVFSVCG